MKGALRVHCPTTNSAATGPVIGAPASVAIGSWICRRPLPGSTSQFQPLHNRL